MRVWLSLVLGAILFCPSVVLAQPADVLTPEYAIRDHYIVVLHDTEAE